MDTLAEVFESILGMMLLWFEFLAPLRDAVDWLLVGGIIFVALIFQTERRVSKLEKKVQVLIDIETGRIQAQKEESA